MTVSMFYAQRHYPQSPARGRELFTFPTLQERDAYVASTPGASAITAATFTRYQRTGAYATVNGTAP